MIGEGWLIVKYVVNLNEVGKNDILLVGGKGANLGEMFQAKFPVPEGFCITSESYDAFIAENNFGSIIEEFLKKIYLKKDESQKLSQKLMDILSKGRLPEKIETGIKTSYKNLGQNKRVAVRSSATAEDLPEASFAGQQETYLNIMGEEFLVHTIKRCFASLWTDRAIAYRKGTGFDKKKISLAVVVQKMIEGDVSGVLFTVNPTNQNRKEMMINASYGLGEAVVSGIVTPDTVIWDCEENQIKNKILGSKEISIIYGQSTGTIQIDNGEEKKNSFSISDEQIEYLVKLGGKIEKYYGYPQDIEWAIKNNKIYVLQARGITTLKNAYKKSHIRNKIINNLIEHCPTPLYPLEFETFKNVMDGKSKVFSEFGIFVKDQLEMTDGGRLEINISSTHMSPRILKIPFKIKHLIDYSNNMKHTNDNFININNKLKSIENNLNSHEYNHNVNINTKKILNLLEEIMKIAKKIIYIRFRYNVFPSFIVGKFIHSKLQKIEKGMTEYDLLSNLEYKTWNMNKSIENLANIVNSNVRLKNEILDLKGKNKDELDSSLEYISASYKDFENCYKHIIDEFGWKSANSYQAFSAVSWNEDKSNFIVLLQAAMKGKFEGEDKNKYEHICDKANNIFSKRTSQKLIKKFKQIRKYHVNREESLYMLEVCYGLSRKIIRMIAYKYPEIFEDDRDILYLTLNEVYKLDEESNSSFFKNQIAIRKKSRIKNKILWEDCELNNSNDKIDVLNGISGNRGKASGKVCIIKESKEFSKLKEGDILVCKYTDPSWTPLFSLAKAVVSDTGGPLSHSAIVAREYNIPAVLGCGSATKILKDGDDIIVDGDKDIVQRLK